jgi:hypothetical protein
MALCRRPTQNFTRVARVNRPSCAANLGPGVVMIKKVSGGYKVLSEKGKNLGGPYKTKAEAEKRLKQVEYFKHSKGK